MSSPLVTISWDDSMETAYRTMKEHDFRHLPVVDAQEKVIGILSDRDVMRAMQSTVSLDDTGVSLYSETTTFDPGAMVRHYMSGPVKHVDVGDKLKSVVDRMTNEKISALLVMESAQVKGIITSEDLLRILADILARFESFDSWTLANVISETDFSAVIRKER